MVAALVSRVLVLSAVGGVLMRGAVIVRGVIVGTWVFSRMSLICRRRACVSRCGHARERVDRCRRCLQGNDHQQHQQKESTQDRHGETKFNQRTGVRQ